MELDLGYDKIYIIRKANSSTLSMDLYLLELIMVALGQKLRLTGPHEIMLQILLIACI